MQGSYSFASHSTHNRTFRRRSSEPISWHSTQETKPNTTNAKRHKNEIVQAKTEKHAKCYTETNTQKQNQNQQSTLTTAHVCVCVYHCAQLSYTIQHRTSVLIIFPLILQRITIAQMLSIRRDGREIHTYEQFLKMSVGLGFVFMCLFRFSILHVLSVLACTIILFL